MIVFDGLHRCRPTLRKAVLGIPEPQTLNPKPPKQRKPLCPDDCCPAPSGFYPHADLAIHASTSQHVPGQWRLKAQNTEARVYVSGFRV